METIAIIGGGFCGSLSAVNLARLAERPLRVVLINSGRPLGRGIAYGTDRPEHLLNVAARNMSALPALPDHFLDWLRTRADYADVPESQLRETFAPRRVYGDYVRGLLFSCLNPIDSRQRVRVEAVEDEVIDLADANDGGLTVSLKSGGSLIADKVLLATGNQTPGGFPGSEEALRHPAYRASPWGDWSSKLPGDDETIVVLGTGLSMVDVFLTLNELDWHGKIVAISRNGKFPQSHFRGIDYPDFLPEKPEELGLEKLAALLEAHCRRLYRLGGNPGIVVDRLRPHTQRIWRNFTLEEKREFLRTYATRWNVVRHRIAQPIHQLMTEAIADGRIRSVRGTIERLTVEGDRLRAVVWDSEEEVTVEGALVINCTGPRSGCSEIEQPLYRNLLEHGLIRSDEMNMGLEVAPDFAVLGGDGGTSRNLYAIGPLMKGSLWETIAVPELRGQARRVAEAMLGDADRSEGRDLRMSIEEEHVVEYYI